MFQVHTCVKKDVRGNLYLAVSIPHDLVTKYLDTLASLLGKDYQRFTDNQQKRDDQRYHMTVLPVPEFLSLDRDTQDMLVGKQATLELVGLGVVKDEGESAYYVIAECEELAELRASLGLPPKAFHVTLGFSLRDIHNQVKDRSTLIDLSASLTEQKKDLHLSENIEDVENAIRAAAKSLAGSPQALNEALEALRERGQIEMADQIEALALLGQQLERIEDIEFES